MAVRYNSLLASYPYMTSWVKARVQRHLNPREAGRSFYGSPSTVEDT